MALRGVRCLAWVLLGDVLPPVSLPRLVATTAGLPQRVRPAHIFVAGGGVAAGAPSSPPTPEDGSAAALARGRELQQRGYLNEAADVLEGVLQAEHDEPDALLQLGEVRAQLGQPRQAASLADRLLNLDRLDPESRSFMLNRRGIYLRSAEDWTGARQSFELALERKWHGQGMNRHALRNLANLLHFHDFPSETAGADISTLERTIELYRAALGRKDALSTEAQRSIPSRPGEMHESVVGSPVDRSAVFSNLAAALLLAGRPGEAIAELELALEEASADVGRWSSSEIVYGEGQIGGGGQVVSTTTAEASAQRSRTTAYLWDSLLRAKLAAGDVAGAIAAGQWLAAFMDKAMD